MRGADHIVLVPAFATVVDPPPATIRQRLVFVSAGTPVALAPPYGPGIHRECFHRDGLSIRYIQWYIARAMTATLMNQGHRGLTEK
jgi:hypothetical protein